MREAWDSCRPSCPSDQVARHQSVWKIRNDKVDRAMRLICVGFVLAQGGGAPEVSGQNKQVAGGLKGRKAGSREVGGGCGYQAYTGLTLRLFRVMSVLEVKRESAAALADASLARGIAESSTKEEELTRPRVKERSAS
jgi:hypothetical protein